MTSTDAQTILAALAIVCLLLAVFHFLKNNREMTLAVKTWGRISFIFAVISLLLNLL